MSAVAALVWIVGTSIALARREARRVTAPAVAV